MLGNGATIDDIPDVPVEEAEDVVSVIVGYVHGESNLLNHLDQSTDPVLPLNVWRAADKYAMPILQDLACKKAMYVYCIRLRICLKILSLSWITIEH